MRKDDYTPIVAVFVLGFVTSRFMDHKNVITGKTDEGFELPWDSDGQFLGKFEKGQDGPPAIPIYGVIGVITAVMVVWIFVEREGRGMLMAMWTAFIGTIIGITLLYRWLGMWGGLLGFAVAALVIFGILRSKPK